MIQIWVDVLPTKKYKGYSKMTFSLSQTDKLRPCVSYIKHYPRNQRESSTCCLGLPLPTYLPLRCPRGRGYLHNLHVHTRIQVGKKLQLYINTLVDLSLQQHLITKVNYLCIDYIRPICKFCRSNHDTKKQLSIK